MRKVAMSMVMGVMVMSSALFASNGMVDGTIMANEAQIVESRALNTVNRVDCTFDMGKIVSKLSQQSMNVDTKSADTIAFKLVDFDYQVTEKIENVYDHRLMVTAKVEYKDFTGVTVSKMGTFEVTQESDTDLVDSDMIRRQVFAAFARELTEVKGELASL